MSKDILIFGNGFIGQRLAGEFDCNISAKRINSFQDIEAELKKYKPGIIINCIGSTGKRNVDDCESDKEKTLWSNSFVPVLMGEAAWRYGIKLVHISSGCIYHFDYERQAPIKEEEEPDFFELFYSRSKIYAEKSLLPLSKKENILIVRLRIPLDCRPHPRNILTKLLQFKKVVDIPNSLTYVPDFIKMLKHLLDIDARGIYNTVNKNGLRYPRLLEVYRKYVPYDYEIIDFRRLNLVRTNLLMSVDKLESTGFKVRAIDDVLEECVKEYITFAKS